MAKKSQTNARRNNTQTGRRVVHFYNNGTINIDARQNRSRLNKTENNGCTINTHHPDGSPVCNRFIFQDQITPVAVDCNSAISTNGKLSGGLVSQNGFVKNAILLTGAVILSINAIGTLLNSK